MLSFRLFAEGDTLGALNLYSKHHGAFDDEAVAVGSVFATHAAVALAGAQHDEQMQKAPQTRDVIGQAKGILMAQQHVTADEAFDVLRRASQRMNIKVRELAERVASRTPPDEREGATLASWDGAVRSGTVSALPPPVRVRHPARQVPRMSERRATVAESRRTRCGYIGNDGRRVWRSRSLRSVRAGSERAATPRDPSALLNLLEEPHTAPGPSVASTNQLPLNPYWTQSRGHP